MWAILGCCILKQGVRVPGESVPDIIDGTIVVTGTVSLLMKFLGRMRYGALDLPVADFI